MKKLAILVTGGNGFIGKNIVEQLGERYNILAPSKNKLDFTNFFAVEEFFKKNKIDVIIHCANIGGNRKKEEPTALSKNLRMFFNIAQCYKYFDKMITLGSGAEYDKRNPLIKVSEADFGKSIPEDDYGLYKYICSRYIEHTDKIINLRLFGLYGKHEDYEIRFISNIICRILFDLPLTMQRNIIFDYLYIDDFIKILDYFISNKPKHKFYNVGTGTSIDLLTVAKKIIALTNTDKNIKVLNKKMGNEYSCDNSRLMKEIGNFTFINMDESLKLLIDWYKKNLSYIRKDDLLRY